MTILSKVIESGDLKTVIDAKINSEFFYGKGKALFDFMMVHYREYRKAPSLEAVCREFSGFTLETPAEPLGYYVDQMRSRHRHNIIVKGLSEIAEKLDVGTADEAEALIYRLTSKLSTEIRLSKDVDYVRSALARKGVYEHKKNFHGIDGIPTLVGPLDDVTGGAHGGELITLLGQPGVGKTWVELVIAKAALKGGYRVLFITKEMEPEQIATRMDAAFLGLPFDKIRRGLLGDELEKEYFQALDDLANLHVDFVISGDSGEGGVTAIQAKIEEHTPDLVIIDGSYLIIDEDGGKSGHEKATNITRALKRLARRTSLPIYNSTQAGRQVNRSKAPSMEDVSFTYAYSQDSDVIISIYRSPEMQVACKLGLKLTKVREGANAGHFILEWDFNNMRTFGTLASDLSEGGMDEDAETVIY